ncbi:MAG: thiamine pyrophosphate-binding protein [Polyangia bacterium]|jgi:acetolactate synthase-1/2/3 large subunit|nr:thiamine pyrophosphate-binding protein [Polyangia bacterium]
MASMASKSGKAGKTAKKDQKEKKRIRGGEILSRMLMAEGVEKVFGIIDGTYFGLYSTLGENGIQLITPRHESCVVHMAGSYSRLTGRLGVCLASNGPGVANVLPGVAVENAEGNRVLLITSSRRVPIIYPDRGGTFQYFPQVEVIGPMAKWSVAVPSLDRLAEIMRMALRRSFTGRPGVVHIDVPEDVMNATVEPKAAWFRDPSGYRPLEPVAPSPGQVTRAARMLAEARFPLIHSGSGVLWAHAEAEVRALAERVCAVLTTSWGGRPVVDERSAQALPMLYLDTIKRARNEADLVLVLGSRLGETDWWGKPPYWAPAEKQRLIQVDQDPEVIGNIRPADLPVQADVKLFLRALLAELERGQPQMNLPERRAQVGALKDAARLRRAELDERLDEPCKGVHTARVVTACQQVFDDEAIFVVDGGNTSVWGNFYLELKRPRTLITTPKMGMLGAGVSQALGAQVAEPDKRVCCLIGDGAMGFHPQEIETAVRNALPVVYVVFCDRQWGMVKMNQQFALRPLKTFLLKSLPPEETINADLGEIEWDGVARAMGAHGERVSRPEDLKPALERARDAGRCAVVHVDVDPVKHMWAPDLKAFKELHEEPQG